MIETLSEILERFKTHINDKSEEIFFIFLNDELEATDSCYYIETTVWGSHSDLVLNGMNDEEVARFEIDFELLNIQEYIPLVLNTFINFIELDLIEENYKTCKNINHNITQVKNLRSA